MDSHKRRLIKASAAAGLVAACAPLRSAWSAPAAGGKPLVVVGQSIPLTGAASEIGLPYAGGAKLFFDVYKQRPDTPVRIEVRQLDDGYDADRAAANAQKLLAEGAELLFGFMGTASSVAGAAVARQKGVVLLAPFAAPDVLRGDAHSHVCLVRPMPCAEVHMPPPTPLRRWP